MIITCTPLATGTLKTHRNGFTEASAVATTKSEDAAATPATFYDSAINENASASVWNQYEIIVGTDRDYTLTNLSSSQTLSGRTVSPVGAGGVGRIQVSDGAVSQILKCDTRVTSGGTYREFVEYEAGTISRYLYDQIESLLDATPDLNYYSTYNHTTSTYTRNASCWAASVDLSCVAVASGDGTSWSRQRGGTLITPRHIVVAWHFPLSIGDQVRFSNAGGTVETRTVIGTSAAALFGPQYSTNYDLLVCVLDSDVTVAEPCKVPGTWILQGYTYIAGGRLTAPPLENGTTNYYCGGLVVHTDQNAKVYAASLASQTEITSGLAFASYTVDGDAFEFCDFSFPIRNFEGAIPYEFASTQHVPVSGDSGQPVLLIVEGEPVLLCVWTTSATGTPTYPHNGEVLNAMIQVANDNAGIVNAYATTVAPDPTL